MQDKFDCVSSMSQCRKYHLCTKLFLHKNNSLKYNRIFDLTHVFNLMNTYVTYNYQNV